ncbi:MAG: stage III sporulation protein AA [Hydrogenibacillus schlegelii]|uniref:Stage III sporulation protein AA n=1 Tax=Hydrogenibacillus schlegelii TaxID=1484 RepID=A0A947CY33_HYDSH|nr:stage III sporulation protein AA [Hydrogenibacillus schlegelii]
MAGFGASTKEPTSETVGLRAMVRSRLLPALPPAIGRALEALSAAGLPEEIRLRAGRPVEVVAGERAGFLTPDGRLGAATDGAVRVSADDVRRTFAILTRHSVYALEEEIRRGYVTLAGGIRVGVAGEAVVEGGRVLRLRSIGSLNIRLPRPVVGAGEMLLPYVLEKNRLLSTILVAPPRGGKTTVLRDLVRLLSAGSDRFRLQGRRVSVIDERSEIAAAVDGVPSFDVGPRTDVLDGTPKAEGIVMAVRALGPEVVAVDELGGEADLAAVRTALSAGVVVLATVHGDRPEALRTRPAFRPLVEAGLFERWIVLRRQAGGVGVQAVYDGALRVLWSAREGSRKGASAVRGGAVTG